MRPRPGPDMHHAVHATCLIAMTPRWHILTGAVGAIRRLSGVTDNSLYPVMFMSYLDVLVPSLKTGPLRM